MEGVTPWRVPLLPWRHTPSRWAQDFRKLDLLLADRASAPEQRATQLVWGLWHSAGLRMNFMGNEKTQHGQLQLYDIDIFHFFHFCALQSKFRGHALEVSGVQRHCSTLARDPTKAINNLPLNSHIMSWEFQSLNPSCCQSSASASSSSSTCNDISNTTILDDCIAVTPEVLRRALRLLGWGLTVLEGGLDRSMHGG